jgi:hypothetical protein
MGRAFSGSRVSFAAQTYELSRQTAPSGLIQTIFRPIAPLQSVSIAPTTIIGGPVSVAVAAAGQKIEVTAAGSAFNTSESGTSISVQLIVDGVLVQQPVIQLPLPIATFDGSAFALDFETGPLTATTHTVDLQASTIFFGSVKILTGGLTISVVSA